MKTKLIAVALVSATAASSAPSFARDASTSVPGTYGRSYAAPASQRIGTFRRAYNHTRVAPEFYDNGWIGEGRSRPGGVDPDFKPAI